MSEQNLLVTVLEFFRSLVSKSFVKETDKTFFFLNCCRLSLLDMFENFGFNWLIRNKTKLVGVPVFKQTFKPGSNHGTRKSLINFLWYFTPAASLVFGCLSPIRMLDFTLSFYQTQQESILISTVVLFLCQIRNGDQGVCLDFPQDFFLGLVRSLDWLLLPSSVSLSFLIELNQSLRTQLFANDLIDDGVVEKCHLPIILVETFRKLLKIALNQSWNIAFRN